MLKKLDGPFFDRKSPPPFIHSLLGVVAPVIIHETTMTHLILALVMLA